MEWVVIHLILHQNKFHPRIWFLFSRYKFYLTLANQIAHYKTDIVNKNLNILVFLTYDHQQIDELMKLMNPAGLMDTTTLRPY